jgi:hypothetical protein
MRWGDANLAVIKWTHPHRFLLYRQYDTIQLGNDREAGKRTDWHGKPKDNATRLEDWQAAVRANRQLAMVLRSQGLNEDADRFAYRAQKFQRQVLRRQGRWGAASGSFLLDLLAGYGYRPGRAILLYLAVILWFANLYIWATHGLITFGLAPSRLQPLAWYEALVLSVSSFHGRGFLPFTNLGDPVTILAAIEAIFGLVIEVSFIATFTQRFFGR